MSRAGTTRQKVTMFQRVGSIVLLGSVLTRRHMRRKLLVLRRMPANVIPRSFGPDEDVHLDLNTWVVVHAAERHAMHFSGGRAAQCAATTAAEA